jgi:hypothetical protein
MFLFGFRKFIAPGIIKFLYYIGLVVLIFGGLGMVLYAITDANNLGAARTGQIIVATLISVPLMILVLRFSAEMWLVLFEMNDRLGDIRDKR